MAVKKKGLGRGLDALFPEKSVKSAEKKPEQKSEQKKNETEASSFPHQLSANTETASNGTAVKAAEMTDSVESVSGEQNKSEMLVKISKVEPNRSQPRKQFDEDALLELSESIKQFGILQPLLVSDKGNYYEKLIFLCAALLCLFVLNDTLPNSGNDNKFRHMRTCLFSYLCTSIKL